MLKQRLQNLVGVYTLQNATFLEITCHGSYVSPARDHFCHHLVPIIFAISMDQEKSRVRLGSELRDFL